MNKIRERMAIFLDSQGVSDYAFEKQLGLSKGYMNKCKNPSGDVLEKMCGIYSTMSAEWLLRGEGEMLRVQSNVNEEMEIDAKIKSYVDKMVKSQVEVEIKKLKA